MGAIISPCGNYRYALTRPSLTPQTGKPLGFCMLNPSTADAVLDDRTISRCRSFAEVHGYNGILVVNVFAFRATDPAELTRQADPVGPKNMVALARAGTSVDSMVVAWGNNAPVMNTIVALKALRGSNPALKLFCLGVNASGSPKHPLYLARDTDLWPYPPAFWHHAESDCVFVGTHEDYAEALYTQGCESINQETYLRLRAEYET